jgi:hypothetical protein
MKIDSEYVMCEIFIGEEKCFFLDVHFLLGLSFIFNVLWNLFLVVNVLNL